MSEVIDNNDDTVSTGQWSDVDYALSTVDNPFSPFDDFTAWYAYDTSHGYRSAELLARVARSSDDLSDADQHAAVQSAIDEIVRENVLGVYRKVSRSDFATTEPS